MEAEPLVKLPEPPDPERAATRVLVVGAGPVGHVLAAGLGRAGFALRHWSRSQGPLWQEPGVHDNRERAAPVDIVILAVRDEAIAQAAEFIVEHGAAGPKTVLLHCAGALSPTEVLARQAPRVAGCGLLHPLRSFTQPPPGIGVDAWAGSAVSLKGTVMALCGDEIGVQAGRKLVEAVGGVPLLLSAGQLPLYHAAAVMAAGHVAALLEVAAHLLRRIGLPREHGEKALAALTRSVLDNIDATSLSQALTGPIARGDASTVARHLEALRRTSCEVTDIYRALSYTAVDMAQRKGVDPETLDRIMALLDHSAPSPNPR
jgi:predicted short-subunit dehydrogenase-like oxidoreductase (DUF2520 family)